MKQESEFGKGLTYCLGLFLAHTERITEYKETYKEIGSDKSRAYTMWFYSAADHIFEFLPKFAPNKSLQNRCRKFQKRVMSLRLPMDKAKEAIESDYLWAIEEAKELLRLIDKANEVPSIKTDFE